VHNHGIEGVYRTDPQRKTKGLVIATADSPLTMALARWWRTAGSTSGN
jgi:hypothetical protein